VSAFVDNFSATSPVLAALAAPLAPTSPADGAHVAQRHATTRRALTSRAPF